MFQQTPWLGLAALAALVGSSTTATAFVTPQSTIASPPCRGVGCHFARKTLVEEPPVRTVDEEFLERESSSSPRSWATGAALTTVAAAATTTTAVAQAAGLAPLPPIREALSPENFSPVCPASDGFYRLLQSSTEALVGSDSAVEYGPLIAGGLLRVRLELCVVESFFNEAVGPFIAKNGLNWVLPFHETVETFLAGTVFAFTATFILLGSTKLINLIVTYADILVGAPSRAVGAFFFDRAVGKPVTLDLGFGAFKSRVVGPPDDEIDQKVDLGTLSVSAFIVAFVMGFIRFCGEAVGITRSVSEAVDLFIGRYLVVWASFYVLIKFLHFKVFPDFPNFI